MALTGPRPDMLVAADAETVAIRGNDGLLHFVRKPKDKFAAREWLRRDGDGRDIAGVVGAFKCDGLGCVAKGKALVAISARPEGLGDDCAQAAVVISAAVAPACKGPAVVIDRDAAREGQGWRVTLSKPPYAESVRRYRGARPWVANQPFP
jgi:competence protein ComEC